jgi:hypothetical protein
MSRSGRTTSLEVPTRRVPTSRIGLWHVACTVALPGCFYVKPIPDVDVNDPPVIVFPDEDPAPVRIQDDRIVMSIGATDEEDGEVHFEWPDLDDVPFTREPFTNGPIQGQRVEVDDPTLLRDDLITALVFDDDPANIVQVRFLVEAP